MSRSRLLLIALTVSILASGCQTVKPYQRIYLNDYEMRQGYAGARNFEESAISFREGTSGGGGSKNSGGCGCN